MNVETIPLDSLRDRATYNVLSDIANRESILASGIEIKSTAKTSKKFRRFTIGETHGYQGFVHIQVDDTTLLALWKDPHMPELQGGDTEQPEPLYVEEVNSTILDRPSRTESVDLVSALSTVVYNLT